MRRGPKKNESQSTNKPYELSSRKKKLTTYPKKVFHIFLNFEKFTKSIRLFSNEKATYFNVSERRKRCVKGRNSLGCEKKKFPTET